MTCFLEIFYKQTKFNSKELSKNQFLTNLLKNGKIWLNIKIMPLFFNGKMVLFLRIDIYRKISKINVY